MATISIKNTSGILEIPTMEIPKVEWEEGQSPKTQKPWFSWNDASSLEKHEFDLLSKSGVKFLKAKVPILETEYINTIHIPNDEKPTLVLLHGFGSGVGFWCANLPDLASNFNLYLIDMPGFGASSRPYIKLESQEDAENFLISSLEEWRQNINLSEKFILSGHSFGGYVSSVYAMKYPEKISQLALIDPWGLIGEPQNLDYSNMSLTFKVGRWFAINGPSPLSAFRIFGKNAAPALITKLRGDLLLKFQQYGTPETIVGYIYTLNCSHPTGELCFNQFRQGLAWAKNPLSERLLNSDLKNHKNIKISFLFGEHTWMSKKTGFQLSREMENAIYDEVPKSGHHLYIESPQEFAERYLKQVLNN